MINTVRDVRISISRGSFPMIFNLLYSLLLIALGSSIVNAQENVLQQTKTYYDVQRDRKLVTEIWLPTRFAWPAPLVMFSHGTGGNRFASRWFCEGLAKKGFVVAAVDHFGNTFDNPIPEEFVSIWKRPQDISFVLSQILYEEEFKGKINESKIFAAGFSLGGYTSIALAGGQIDHQKLVNFFKTRRGQKEIDIPEMPGLIDLLESKDIALGFKENLSVKDKRINGIIMLAPSAGQGFSSNEQMKAVDVPVLIVGVAADSIVPIATNTIHYHRLLIQSQLHLISNKAGHYVFLNEGTIELKKAAPLFFIDQIGVDRSEIHLQVIALAEQFLRNPVRR
jgi:predicted dienelactone hydrolase